MQNGNGRTRKGAYIKGQSKPAGSGRKKGAKNKVPADVANDFHAVFMKLGGIEGFFKTVSKTDHNKMVFYQNYARLLPRTLEGSFVGNVTVIVKSAIPRPPKKAKPKAGSKTGATK